MVNGIMSEQLVHSNPLTVSETADLVVTVWWYVPYLFAVYPAVGIF